MAGRRRNIAVCVDPLQLPVVGAGAIATGDLVGSVPVITVSSVLEEDTGLVVAVDEWNWESGRNSFDQRQLEVAEKRVGQAIPAAPELFATAEGQIVNDAAGEAVVQVDLRKTPVQMLPVG